MVTLSEKFVDEALSLPSNLRAVLVDKLLESLNIPSQKQIDALWSREAEKRYKAIKTRKISTISGENVFKEIRTKYGK